MFLSRDTDLSKFSLSFWSPICFQYIMLSEAFFDSSMTKQICLLLSLGFHSSTTFVLQCNPTPAIIPACALLFFFPSHWIVDSLKTQAVNSFPQHFQTLLVGFENQSQNDAQSEKTIFPKFCLYHAFFYPHRESSGEYFLEINKNSGHSWVYI